jgi:hypothetical protein
MKIAGAFFQNFFNIAMGLTILFVVDQFFEPLHRHETIDITVQQIVKREPQVDEGALRTKLLDAWNATLTPNDSNLEAVFSGPRTFAAKSVEFSKPLFKAVTPEELNQLTTNIEVGLSGVLKQELWLLAILFLFIIKYIHEADRVDSLLLAPNTIPGLLSFALFMSRILALAFVILFAKLATLHPEWWLLVLIFGAFFIHDLGLLLARVWKKLPTLPKGMSSLRFWWTVGIWLGLDFLPIVFAFGMWTGQGVANVFTPNFFAVVIGCQVFIPYFANFRFYFHDFETEIQRL